MDIDLENQQQLQKFVNRIIEIIIGKKNRSYLTVSSAKLSTPFVIKSCLINYNIAE